MVDIIMDSKVEMEIVSLKDLDQKYHWENKLDIHWEDLLKECQARTWWQCQWQRQKRYILPQYDSGSIGVCPAWVQAGSWS